MLTSARPQNRSTLWKAADELRANSTLAPNEYRGPVLGLVFLAYAEHRFGQVEPELKASATPRRPVTPADYRARSVLFVPEGARLSALVELPEGDDLGKAVDACRSASRSPTTATTCGFSSSSRRCRRKDAPGS